MRWPLLLLLLSHMSYASHSDHSHHDSTHHELQEVSSDWDEREHENTYVHYPDEMREVLDESFKVLMRSPELYIFTTVPEPANARVWPLVKGMTLRNHLDNKILWTIPNYLITDGLDFGCRQMVDGVEQHMPVENAICSDHCTHQGRYCAPFHPSSMPEELPKHFQGKELVKESLRRVCFDKYYHGSDIKYFEYLEGFERAQCLQQPDVTECALQVIVGIDHADYSNLAECVDEENWENDVINEHLQQQLEDAKHYDAHLDNMPLVYIGNDLYTGKLNTNHIFEEYCSKFEDRPMKPISCHVCGDMCPNGDTRHCLWTLECAQNPFDPQAFLNEYQKDYVETDPPATTLAPTKVTVVEEQGESATATLPPMPGAEHTAGSPSGSEASKAYKAKEIQDDKQAIRMFGIVLLVCLVIVGVLVLYRNQRSKQLMKEAYAESKLATYPYRDDDMYSDSVMFSDSVDRTGENDFELSPSKGGAVQRHKGGLPPSSTFLPEVA
jgi:hypothetical protein